ncbi:GvpL/GvpF family gas vesicle protein [Promicromonospora sukumoe]|uniref:GvpL/GvpF family gas vesicle protein n=1 Tax=Promicromonospora sukumoe TaxID=88382 RepID=UPI00035FED94|nr:GvpL/GvpF family gas vesicle protein [Promicromonospora sukumoe]
MTADRLYLYGVVTTAPAELGTGIDGLPLHAVPGPEGIAALVHDHEGEPYQGADADVERWVVEHSAAVERIWQNTGTILPATFNVIVAPTREMTAGRRLQDWLATHASSLRDRLDALSGRVELRVEIGLDHHLTGGRHPEVVAARTELKDRPPGVQRLLRKRLDHLERDITEAVARERFDSYHQVLKGVSDEVDENRRARPDPDTALVLSASLLVRADAVHDVGAALTAIQEAEPAARIRYLGPWPPYSFADILRTAPPDETG